MKLTPKEIKVFQTKFIELLEHVRLYGHPYETNQFMVTKMMAYRLNAIKARPELLHLAKSLDVTGIIF